MFQQAELLNGRGTSETIPDLIGRMKAISLEEMSLVRLMKRRDTKYLLPFSDLPYILKRLSDHYRVQEIEGKRMAAYKTVYYDSCGHQFYLEHVNGKLNRRKVRVRSYLDSGHHFLEVKRKTNRSKTVKIRIQLDGQLEKQDARAIELVRDQADADLNVHFPSLINRFTRITLVNADFTERLTIDFDLRFGLPERGDFFNQNDLCIIEVKQEKNGSSFISELLRDLRIKKAGFSKYCYGMVMTGQVQKVNNMKRKLRRIQKIIHHEYVVKCN
jgi:hypothetical protein